MVGRGLFNWSFLRFRNQRRPETCESLACAPPHNRRQGLALLLHSRFLFCPPLTLSVPDGLPRLRGHRPALGRLESTRLVPTPPKNELHRQVVSVDGITQVREGECQDVQFIEQLTKAVRLRRAWRVQGYAKNIWPLWGSYLLILPEQAKFLAGAANMATTHSFLLNLPDSLPMMATRRQTARLQHDLDADSAQRSDVSARRRRRVGAGSACVCPVEGFAPRCFTWVRTLETNVVLRLTIRLGELNVDLQW